MLYPRLLAAIVLSLVLLLGSSSNVQAAVGVRGIVFCQNGEEIWIDVGPYYYDRNQAKVGFDDQVYSVCNSCGGLSFFTRNYYYGGATCLTPPQYWETWDTPYWGY
jgi:hypothetical protein